MAKTKVMDKTEELKFLEKVVGHLSGQTAAEPADDLFNKMGILKEYLYEYTQQESREVAINFASDYLQVEKELIEPEFNEWQKQKQ